MGSLIDARACSVVKSYLYKQGDFVRDTGGRFALFDSTRCTSVVSPNRVRRFHLTLDRIPAAATTVARPSISEIPRPAQATMAAPMINSVASTPTRHVRPMKVAKTAIGAGTTGATMTSAVITTTASPHKTDPHRLRACVDSDRRSYWCEGATPSNYRQVSRLRAYKIE
jgi:hypothetical protein